MENSAPEPNYMEILRDYPRDQVSLGFEPNLELLQNGDVLPDCAEYEKLRADILAGIVSKFVQSEVESSVQLQESEKLARLGDQQNLEFENEMLKSLISSTAAQQESADAVDEMAVFRQIVEKIRAGQSASECVLQILLENQTLTSENRRMKEAALGLSKSAPADE